MLIEIIFGNKKLNKDKLAVIRCDKCLTIRRMRPSRLFDQTFSLCNRCCDVTRHICNDFCYTNSKTCNKCKLVQTLENFDIKLYCDNKHVSICKSCRKTENALYKNSVKTKNGNHICNVNCETEIHYCRQCEVHRPLKHFRVYNSSLSGHFKWCLFCATKKDTTRNKSREKRNITFALAQEEFFNLVDKLCCVCGQFSKNRLVSGVDRRDNKLGYTTLNCFPMCEIHNIMKGDLLYEDFLQGSFSIATHFHYLLKEN